MRILEELAAMKLARERLVDLTAGEVEAGEIAIVREPRRLERKRRFQATGCSGAFLR